jgi:2-dehydro-3-deoxygluconokinase
VDRITSSTEKALDLITIGESMWRLSPPGRERLEAARTLDIHLGGAESNVALALARLGKTCAWWSRLPDNALGKQVANTLRMHGVDVSGVRWSEGRLGTYFVEFGSSPRQTQVIYDRANSAASQMQPDDFNWVDLQHAHWLHLTGITPALSASCLETIQRAIQKARTAKINISFDINYRAKLWMPDQAARTLDELAKQCTLVMAAERDIRNLFKLEGSVEDLLKHTYERWNGATIVITHGKDGSSAYDGNSVHHADIFQVENPIQIGGGDAFDAGLLCALMDGKSLQNALVYGNALAALKMTVPGDIALVSRAEVENLLVSNPSSNVVR